MKKLVLSLLALALAAGIACSPERPAREAEVEKKEEEPQALTARVALQRILPQARLWAADAQLSRMESHSTGQAGGAEGTSTIWRTHFVTPGRGRMRTFVWSGATGPDAPEPGVRAGTEDPWSPVNRETQPFDIAFLRTDSDQAFEVAQKNGGAAILKKDAAHPVSYMLEWDHRRNQLVWHVLYGTDRFDAKLRVAVDASTGLFLRIEK